MPPKATKIPREYAVDAPAPRLITKMAESFPSSAAFGSVACMVAAGSSAIVAVAKLPSFVKVTVSGPSTSSVNVGVTVTVVEV